MKTKYSNIEVLKRAHKIARCFKRQLPAGKYAILFRRAIRQAYHERKISIMRDAVILDIQEYGYTPEQAYNEVLTMSDYYINLYYHSSWKRQKPLTKSQTV